MHGNLNDNPTHELSEKCYELIPSCSMINPQYPCEHLSLSSLRKYRKELHSTSGWQLWTPSDPCHKAMLIVVLYPAKPIPYPQYIDAIMHRSSNNDILTCHHNNSDIVYYQVRWPCRGHRWHDQLSRLSDHVRSMPSPANCSTYLLSPPSRDNPPQIWPHQHIASRNQYLTLSLVRISRYSASNTNVLFFQTRKLAA